MLISVSLHLDIIFLTTSGHVAYKTMTDRQFENIVGTDFIVGTLSNAFNILLISLNLLLA